MPKLETKDDPAIYDVETPVGFVRVNARELTASLAKAGAQEGATDITPHVKAFDEVAGRDNGEPLDTSQFTDVAKYAIVEQVASEWIKSGNALGPSQT